MRKKISILLPVLNEGQNIIAVTTDLFKIFDSSPQYSFEIIFIDDGSSDNTLSELIALTGKTDNIFYISFSRNFGKDNALLAGLRHCSGDAVITMDADLQHPPQMIVQLLQAWENGYEIAYCYRDSKNIHSGIFSQLASKLFYKTINLFSDINLENGLSDFRLLNRKAVDVLSNLNEANPFFRGLVKWIGFKQIGIPYNPDCRTSGKSRYKTISLLKLAINGITSFSVKPLNIAIYLGFFFSFLSILYLPYALISLLIGNAVSGWASLIVTVAFFGGLNLMILGIVGIYLGKLFMQDKQRPQYIIRESNIKAPLNLPAL